MKTICTYRLITKTVVALLFTGLPLLSNAQGELPCNDSDPFNSACPLDTWVLLVVIIAGLFTAVYLHRKQKSLRA